MPGTLPAFDPASLSTLARLWGVQASYRDVEGNLRRGSAQAVLAILAALGAPVVAEGARSDEIASAIVARQRQLWERPVEPVIVAWDGRLHALSVRLPEHAAEAAGDLQLRLEREDGVVESLRPESCSTWGSPGDVDGRRFVELRLQLERTLPLGYHRLVVEATGVAAPAEALVVAAPRRAVAAPEPWWGVFCPLYALRSDRACALGIGDVADLRSLLGWVEGLGGSLVATLPLLPTFLDETFEPSPYSPVSRRFWNEIYIDLGDVPEVAESPGARQALGEARQELEAAGVLSGRLVDYRRVDRAKRRVLTAAAARLSEGGSERQEALRRFVAGQPDVEAYAAFRAACEQYHAPWMAWPATPRDGRLDLVCAPEAARHYHRYVQFLADSQIGRVAAETQAALLFDLPLGGHPAGFDVWFYRDLFLTTLCSGAPPDPMNSNGQNWGNPPVHPERARESGYTYFRACIRHLLGHGGVLRIDHVPGLHRMFVLPRSGGAPGDGAYLHSPADELYALLCLESHRARGGRGAVIVGEDLGTVPGYVRTQMARHGVYRCYVAEFGIDTGTGRTPDGHLMPGSQVGGASLQRPPANSFASLNTHDVAPFAAFWQGTDIAESLGLGLISEAQARDRFDERATQRQTLVAALRRAGLLAGADQEGLLAGTDQEEHGDPAVPSEGTVLEAWLAWLAGTDAQAVVVTLEDLWGETGAQNLPGTTDEHPNWRRRTAMSLDAIRSSETVVGRLKAVNVTRRQAERPPRPHPGRAGRAEGVAP